MTGEVFALVTFGGLAAAASIRVGCLGVRGSNRPAKVRPFLALAGVGLALDLVQVVMRVAQGGVFALSFDVVLDTLFMGACVYLAIRVDRQPVVPDEDPAQDCVSVLDEARQTEGTDL